MEEKKKASIPVIMSKIYGASGGAAIAFIMIAIVMSFTTDTFLSVANLMNLIKQAVPFGLIAFGLTFTLISGDIDLSVGATIALSSVLVATLIKSGVSYIPAILLVIFICICIGAINGTIIAKTPIPSFIVTLAMQKVVRGVAYIISNGLPVNFANDHFKAIGNSKIFGFMPTMILWLFAIAVVLAFILKRTIFGRYIYAVGGNKETAVYSGIPVVKVKIAVYVISAILASLAGIIMCSRIMQGQPTAAEGYESLAIASAVIGGTSFKGGRGNILGTLMGALVLAIITNSLYLLDVNVYIQMVVQGCLILIAVFIDTMKSSRDN